MEIPRRRHSRGAANLCVKLPREMRVSVSAANGRVDVEGIRGAVEVRSSNGAASIHEVVGDVIAVGKGVRRFAPGDRLVVAHHVPCFACHYCRRGSPSMCRQF